MEKFTKPVPPTQNSIYSQPKRRTRWVLWIMLVLIVIASYSTIRFLLDRYYLSKGEKAYQSANCEEAIQYYDKIVNGWRLMDLGEYSLKAKQENKECISYLEAINLHQIGDSSAALLAYIDFTTSYNESPLVDFVRLKSKLLFYNGKPSELAGSGSCHRIQVIREQDLFADVNVNLPPLYFECGLVFTAEDSQELSMDMYEALLTEFPNHALVTEAESNILANTLACERVDSFKENKSISNRLEFIPALYFQCGKLFDSEQNYAGSFELYKELLTEFPEHQLADEAETALLDNPTSCEEYLSIVNTVIGERPNFLPSLYFRCGQMYENEKNWDKAILMYDSYMADFPDHSLASEVEIALARSIVEKVAASDAGEIPEPTQSGRTEIGVSMVIIQNDSPERLRIVFSGPESRVVELGACSSCKTYFGAGPLSCPSLGPIGRYSLIPGEYNIVVESISSSSTIPWKGIWNLVSGFEYSHCFYIVRQISP